MDGSVFETANIETLAQATRMYAVLLQSHPAAEQLQWKSDPIHRRHFAIMRRYTEDQRGFELVGSFALRNRVSLS